MKTDSPDKPTEPKSVKVKLGKPHTHEGVDHDAGASIDVTEAERDWLSAAGVIKSASQEAQKP